MNLSTENLPARLNHGWTYKYHVGVKDRGRFLVEFLSSTFTNSSKNQWNLRLKLGEIFLNQVAFKINQKLNLVDLITWERTPLGLNHQFLLVGIYCLMMVTFL